MFLELMVHSSVFPLFAQIKLAITFRAKVKIFFAAADFDFHRKINIDTF